MTKQQIEREISELNARYSREKSKLKNQLFELEQLEKEKRRTVKLTNRNDWNICYFEKPLTQENYHKALRVCRKLFLGD